MARRFHVCCTTLYICFCLVSGSVPRFLVEPQSAIVRPGSSVTLRCSVDLETAATAVVRWTVNGTTLAAQRRRGFELRDGGSVLRILSFNHPEPLSHEGIYQCMATNAIGSVVSREAKLEAAGWIRNNVSFFPFSLLISNATQLKYVA